MSQAAEKTDRYISFEGIECDEQAQRVLHCIRDCTEAPQDGPSSSWTSYFERKLVEIARMGQDELFFVGSQVNYIRELFEHHGHRAGLDLLDQIEDECC
ncbi:N(2)-fixation sustaining protein CowN [Allochromatium palmeri]|uniref:N(2)-fixation sustaining protein CowN n=1 Tax=Allochromatium palmeri TaxID=231048 RepID=A0A6N8EAB9_9GAMM|nr:N(2)-fixation sustaining protein CowN [Allochromatium palmeri]